MAFWRNVTVITLIIAVLASALWFLFSWPRQVEERLRGFLGDEICRDWRFRSLAQEGLEEIRAREIVIPAEPVHEWRELAVLTGVRIRTDGPFVPSLNRHQLDIDCAVCEVSVEEAKGVWNCVVPGRKVLELVRGRLLRQFTSREVLRIQVRREGDRRLWQFRLEGARLAAAGDDRVSFEAVVHHESWAGGTVKVELSLEPWSLSIDAEGRTFSGAADLLALILGDLAGVTVEGTADLSLSGRSAGEAMEWQGLLKATNMRVCFPAAGLTLSDLVGAIDFQNGQAKWEALAGTISGLDMTSSGELSVSPERRGWARLDFPSLSLSVAWPRLVKSGALERFFSKTPPGGVLRGTVQLANALELSGQEMSGDFFGEELTLGNTARMERVRIEGRLIQGVLREGSIAWEAMALCGIQAGKGTLAVRQGKSGWTVAEFSLAAGSQTVVGDGEFVQGDAPALKLKLRLPQVPLADLMRLFGLGTAPEGTGSGVLDVLYSEGGTIFKADALSLQNVAFSSFLGKLSEVVLEGTKLSFPSGRAAFRAEGGRLSISRAVLAAEKTVAVLAGEITPEGQAAIKILILDRGGLLEDVLFASDPKSWPLSEEERQKALSFEFSGAITGSNFTRKSYGDFFGE